MTLAVTPLPLQPLASSTRFPIFFILFYFVVVVFTPASCVFGNPTNHRPLLLIRMPIRSFAHFAHTPGPLHKHANATAAEAKSHAQIRLHAHYTFRIMYIRLRVIIALSEAIHTFTKRKIPSVTIMAAAVAGGAKIRKGGMSKTMHTMDIHRRRNAHTAVSDDDGGEEEREVENRVYIDVCSHASWCCPYCLPAAAACHSLPQPPC